MKFICEGCGKVAEYDDLDKAFKDGWDFPPHLKNVITCPDCPSAPILFKKLSLPTE